MNNMTPGMSGDDELSPARFNRDVSGTRVAFGPGAVGELPLRLEAIGSRRAFVVTTGGRSAALLAPEALLADRLAGLFEGAREHVPVATVAAALERFRAARADACVAVGGGSAIGLGKAIARATGAPLVAVPTTYSGSEMTSIWGETDAQGKRTGRDPRAKPSVVVYDVTLTFDLPAAMSAASGMNAMAHAVEAMYAAGVSDASWATAVEAVRLLARSLPAVVQNGRDLRVRTAALAGAHLAGRALEETSMGLHHRICHVLGGTFGLPHARTHAVVLPHVVAFNAPAAPKAMTRLADLFMKPDVAGALAALDRAVGIHSTLRDLGLRAEDVERAAEEIAAKPYANPRPATKDDVRAVLMAAF